jgi:hypothetical protein
LNNSRDPAQSEEMGLSVILGGHADVQNPILHVVYRFSAASWPLAVLDVDSGIVPPSLSLQNQPLGMNLSFPE